MYPQDAAGRFRRLTVFLRLGQRGDGLRQIVANQLGRHFGGRVAENQHGRCNAAAPEFPRLVETGHGQVVTAQHLEFPRDL